MRRSLSSIAGLLGLLAVLLIGPASENYGGQVGRSSLAQSSTAAENTAPSGHFKVTRPADLSSADALAIYERVADEIARGYAVSHARHAEAYRRWPRYNTTPYRSATHGERFVNNYANAKAATYDRLDEIEQLPVGAVLAKDSFAVTGSGDIFPGPLFLMEKMPAGFRPDARDWRYTMIMPDGSLFGTTNGEGSARVEFCITCHRAAGDDQDHLFYIPEGHRARVLHPQ